MFGLKAAVGDGVRGGLSKAFAPGGSFSTALSQALDKGLEPVRQELARLRKIEWRHQWHGIDTAPAWLKDGRAALVAEDGDMYWAAYVTEPGEEPYWDRDLEYGGTCCEPTHFFLLPKPPFPVKAPLSPSEASAGKLDGEGARDELLNPPGGEL